MSTDRLAPPSPAQGSPEANSCRQLPAYSAAAAALGLAGFAGGAHGAVVAIDDLSPLLVAGQPVADASFLRGPPGISFTSLDLDDDGVADLQLRTDNYLYPALYTGKQIVFQGLNGGGLVNRDAAGDIYTEAAVFAPGETIAGELRSSFSLAMDNVHPRELDGAGLFVGFQTAAGHFGYLTIDADRAADTLQIVGGAYESTGGQIVAGAAPIPEPATTSLALLALGAVGLAERRRRRLRRRSACCVGRRTASLRDGKTLRGHLPPCWPSIRNTRERWQVSAHALRNADGGARRSTTRCGRCVYNTGSRASICRQGSAWLNWGAPRKRSTHYRRR